MPGQNSELLGDRDLGDIYPLLACDALELMPQRTAVPTGVMGRLDEQPAHIGIALLGAFYYPYLWPGACLNMALDTPGLV